MIRLALASIVSLVLTTQSYASIIIVADPNQSTSGLGDFRAVFDYQVISATEAKLKIILKNRSVASNGGFITAVVFNNPSDLIDGATFSTTDSDFQLMGAPTFDNSISASPFKNFDFGAGLDAGDFAGGGSPTGGIAVDTTETFTYLFTGTNLDTLTEQDFVDELSDGSGAGNNPQFFLVRFRGFNDDGSDKSVGAVIHDPNNSSIPEPATIVIWSIVGFVGGASVVRRKMKQRPAA